MTDATGRVRRAGPGDAALLTAILADGFMEDPVSRWLFPDAGNRDEPAARRIGIEQVHNRPHRPQRIRRMVEAGLNVTINTDDPAMFETNLGHGFMTLFESIGWGPDMARRFSLNSVEGSWLDASDKSALRLAFRKEIAALDQEFGYTTAAPTV